MNNVYEIELTVEKYEGEWLHTNRSHMELTQGVRKYVPFLFRHSGI